MALFFPWVVGSCVWEGFLEAIGLVMGLDGGVCALWTGSSARCGGATPEL